MLLEQDEELGHYCALLLFAVEEECDSWFQAHDWLRPDLWLDNEVDDRLFSLVRELGRVGQVLADRGLRERVFGEQLIRPQGTVLGLAVAWYAEHPDWARMVGDMTEEYAQLVAGRVSRSEGDSVPSSQLG